MSKWKIHHNFPDHVLHYQIRQTCFEDGHHAVVSSLQVLLKAAKPNHRWGPALPQHRTGRYAPPAEDKSLHDSAISDDRPPDYIDAFGVSLELNYVPAAPGENGSAVRDRTSSADAVRNEGTTAAVAKEEEARGEEGWSSIQQRGVDNPVFISDHHDLQTTTL